MVSYKEYKCECGKETNYGIWVWDDGEYSIFSCDSPYGCVAASTIKYCPYCGKELPKAPSKDGR